MNPNDSFIFWSALYFTPVVWILLGMGAVFSFSAQDLLIGQPRHAMPSSPQGTNAAIDVLTHSLLCRCGGRVVAVALMLSGANIVGYWKCQKGPSSRLQAYTSTVVGTRAELRAVLCVLALVCACADAGRRIQSFTQNWLISRMTQQATGSGTGSGGQ